MNTCECQLPQRLHVSTVFCSQRGLCCHRLSSAHHHKALTRGWGWSQHYSRCTKSNKGIKRRSQNWKAQNTNARSFLLLIYARRRISKLFTTAHYHTRAEMSRQRMGERGCRNTSSIFMQKPAPVDYYMEEQNLRSRLLSDCQRMVLQLLTQDAEIRISMTKVVTFLLCGSAPSTTPLQTADSESCKLKNPIEAKYAEKMQSFS